jgi:hypothetical protein
MAEPNVVPRHIERDLGRESATAELRNELRYEAGGPDEGALRALIYIRRPDGAADERGFRMLKIIRDTRKAWHNMNASARFGKIVCAAARVRQALRARPS